MPHTPGPFHADHSGERIAIWALGDKRVFLGACSEREIGRRQAEANAALFVAAPDLLIACESALRDLGDLEQHWKNEAESFDHPSETQERQMALDNLESTRRTITQIRAAIAKAKGISQ